MILLANVSSAIPGEGWHYALWFFAGAVAMHLALLREKSIGKMFVWFIFGPITLIAILFAKTIQHYQNSKFDPRQAVWISKDWSENTPCIYCGRRTEPGTLVCEDCEESVVRMEGSRNKDGGGLT